LQFVAKTKSLRAKIWPGEESSTCLRGRASHLVLGPFTKMVESAVAAVRKMVPVGERLAHLFFERSFNSSWIHLK